MSWSSRSVSVVLGSLLVVIAGCADKGAGSGMRAKVYKVTGSVTYRGNPIADAAVSFSPTGTQPAAVGRTNDDGAFSLTTYRAGDGAAEGDFKVMITLIDAGASAPPEEAHGTTPGVDYSAKGHSSAKRKGSGSILPAVYSDPANTPLTATVKAGEKNEFTFELK